MKLKWRLAVSHCSALSGDTSSSDICIDFILVGANYAKGCNSHYVGRVRKLYGDVKMSGTAKEQELPE